jgi:hypothetical protein
MNTLPTNWKIAILLGILATIGVLLFITWAVDKDWPGPGSTHGEDLDE